jgi:uncharacterized membrane protein
MRDRGLAERDDCDQREQQSHFDSPIRHIDGAMPTRHQICLLFQTVPGLLQGKILILPQPDHAIILRRRNTRVRVICRIIVEAGGSPVRMWPGAETHTRSILKAISWRTLGTIDTFAISWFMTGRVEIAGSIAALELGTKIAWYYLHERVWAMVDWGRRHA